MSQAVFPRSSKTVYQRKMKLEDSFPHLSSPVGLNLIFSTFIKPPPSYPQTIHHRNSSKFCLILAHVKAFIKSA